YCSRFSDSVPGYRKRRRTAAPEAGNSPTDLRPVSTFHEVCIAGLDTGRRRSVFVSFFPKPRLFFSSAVLWTVLAVAVWYLLAKQAGTVLGLPQASGGSTGVSIFWSAPFLWFDLYCAVAAGIFAAIWMTWIPHPWARWSIIGSASIIFADYLQVEASV